jgi:hypothetical protein
MAKAATILTTDVEATLIARLRQAASAISETTKVRQQELDMDKAALVSELSQYLDIARVAVQRLAQIKVDFDDAVRPYLRPKDDAWGNPSKGRNAICYYRLADAVDDYTTNLTKYTAHLRKVGEVLNNIASLPPQQRQTAKREFILNIENWCTVPDRILQHTLPAIVQYAQEVATHEGRTPASAPSNAAMVSTDFRTSDEDDQHFSTQKDA